jgi:type II secretory pathway pseudopilin PulG
MISPAPISSAVSSSSSQLPMTRPTCSTLDPRPSTFAAAFSLIEMMVTIGLLGFIIIGLVSMFGYTQRAFRAGMTQSDVLEAGRAAAELMAGDLASATPASLRYPVGSGNVTNLVIKYYCFTTNQILGTTPARTNEIESIFLLTQENEKWTGVGYVVALPAAGAPDPATSQLGYGSLYRWQYPRPGDTINTAWKNPASLAENFLTNASYAVSNFFATQSNPNSGALNLSTNFTRVCDGVVHLRFQAFAPTAKGGFLITNNLGANIFATTNGVGNLVLHEIEYQFTSNAVPAYLEVELGLLEDGALKRLNALPSAARASYLARPTTGSRIHLFRRRLPVHNANNDAYP